MKLKKGLVIIIVTNTLLLQNSTSFQKKFSKDVFDERVKQAKLVKITDLDTKLQEVEKKINANKTKISLIETEVKKIDASYFRGKNCFSDDGTQNCLVFQPSYKYFDVTNFEINSWGKKRIV